MKIGYCRVSTDDQSLDVQRKQLLEAGCERIHEETASGKSRDGRPELQTLMQFMRAGDVLIVTKLDRLARNTLDMLSIITELGEKGVGFKSLAEPWADTTNAAGKLMLVVMSGVAEFDRDRIRERQAEGIAAAKEKGIYKGAKQRFDPEAIRAKAAEGLGPTAIAKALGCTPMTVHRALKTNGASCE